MVDPSSLKIMHFFKYTSLTQETRVEMLAQETHDVVDSLGVLSPEMTSLYAS